MKKFNTLLLLILFISVGLTAQDGRYRDLIFDNVNIEANQIYGSNISVLTGDPVEESLFMDIYTPEGDTETERPVIIYMHTGSYLPQYLNGQITGGRLDSTVVEICTQLAKSGYVAIAAGYRGGWIPSSTDQNTRTGTLLNAAYRGLQDLRTCIRYVRKSVAEDGNPYGIDPDKIGAWGQGTGGYNVLGAAFLDDFSELILEKFIDTNTGLPYVDSNLVGNIFASTDKPLCIANHASYSSDFKLAVNMGGALGDISWIDGSPNEPATIGFHVVTDPFAPFADGAVIVPVTGDFVVNVSGSRTAVGAANMLGTNDVFQQINDLNNPLNTTVSLLSGVPITLQGFETTLATENMYPLITPDFRLESGPWEWWDKDLLDVIIPGVNATFGTDLDSDTLHINGLITNPDMSKEKALAYIDTMMTYFRPRACAALELEGCLEEITSSREVIASNSIDLTIAPIPAQDQVLLSVNDQHFMQSVQLFDLQGRLMETQNNLDSKFTTIDRNKLPAGIYIVKIQFEEGILSRRIMFE